MANIVVFGIEIDERCAEYLQLVVKYASSGDSDAREVRRQALVSLGRNHCRKALIYLIERYATSGDSDLREVRRLAFEALEMIENGEM